MSWLKIPAFCHQKHSWKMFRSLLHNIWFLPSCTPQPYLPSPHMKVINIQCEHDMTHTVPNIYIVHTTCTECISCLKQVAQAGRTKLENEQG